MTFLYQKFKIVSLVDSKFHLFIFRFPGPVAHSHLNFFAFTGACKLMVDAICVLVNLSSILFLLSYRISELLSHYKTQKECYKSR